MRPPEFDPPPLLTSLMESQDGVFTAAQAYRVGYTHAELQRLREREVLESVRRGVYAVRDVFRGLEGPARHRVRTRAVLLVLRQPTLSHVTAAVWSDLPLLRPDLRRVHVTRPALHASRAEGGVYHHPGSLPPEHVVVENGVARTSDARTAVDLARGSDFPRALAAVDSALRRGTTAAVLRRTLFACASWPGARGASRAVALGDGRAANPGESFSRALLVGAGLGPTDLQVAVHDAAGLVGYADVGWLPLRVLGEFDGRGKYGSAAPEAAEAVWAEKRREDRLRAAGYRVLRWTWADLRAPGPWLEQVRQALASAERATVA